ncbi:MAG TPA: hypothetical protein VFV67_06035 [Actinophytocola sp.]|uniref:vWA domain-containing protein n=1 Tax=Actinophytocola sp. TaxID=1872138 RepID=UPI002DB6FFFB|nr:hypothetical protein [Actinophytocola sp.]HEU5470194.1 hypothetical protein [Actinophytocola sp.]
MHRTDAITTEHAAILPIYLVCDLSSSMREDRRVEALRDALTGLRDAVWANPVVSDCARIGVIGFAGRAWLCLPLCDIATVGDLPVLEPDGLTSYAAAFRLLHRTVRSDVEQLAADQYRVLRPLVFFVSDGEPTDRTAEWVAELAILRTAAVRPEIITFAIGEASAATLRQVATARCFVASVGTAVRDAIAEIGAVVIRSVVASSTSGQAAVAGPPPDGFDELDLL